MITRINPALRGWLLAPLILLSGCTLQVQEKHALEPTQDGVSEVFIAAAKKCHSDVPGSEKLFTGCLKTNLDASIQKLQMLSDCVSSTEGCKPKALQSAHDQEIK